MGLAFVLSHVRSIIQKGPSVTCMPRGKYDGTLDYLHLPGQKNDRADFNKKLSIFLAMPPEMKFQSLQKERHSTFNGRVEVSAQRHT